MDNSTLKAASHFDARDICRLSTAPVNNRIDQDSIPTFVLGTIINSIQSTYSNTPIFNLANLNDAQLLDLNAQSAAEDEVKILLTSNKAAASSSSAFSSDLKASANVSGLFGASAAFHHEQSKSLAQSDGNVYVSMQRGKKGSYYEIIIKDLKAGYDLTPYLIGTPIPQAALETYISVKKKRKGFRTYVAELIFGGYEQSGLVNWDQRNIYGNIQLITRMEEVFSDLLEQYETFRKDPEIQAILYSNLYALKGKIGHALRDFYAHVGTHFVRKLHFCNYAYASGTLKFTDGSGNDESRLGASLSINGGIPDAFSTKGEGAVTLARKNGWANAMKNLTIEAHARPSDIVAIDSFASQVLNMLNSQDQELSVPNLTIPGKAEVKLLDIPAEIKDPLRPPDSVFKSYDEWKQYQDDKKKDAKGKDRVAETIDNGEVELRDMSLDSLIKKKVEDGANSRSASTPEPYEAWARELDALRATGARGPGQTPSDDSPLRIDNMFVCGYETEPYESVIPSLRTSKIALPDKTGGIDTYPNATQILLVINLFRQLADYTSFLSNYSISNVSPEFARCIETFHDLFSDKGNELVTSAMSAGRDVTTELMASFAASMYGDPKSRLFETLGLDQDRVTYVKGLLQPAVMRLWRDAPGGYAPFFFESDGSLRFAGLDHLLLTPELDEKQGWISRTALHFNLSKTITDVPEVTQLYAGLSETPLYPVFRYCAKLSSQLLFLQFAGRFQLIYGSNGVILPDWSGTMMKPTPTTLSLVAGTISSSEITDVTGPLLDELLKEMKGFDLSALNTEYALYIPQKTQSEALRQANRVAMLTFDWAQTFKVKYAGEKYSKEGHSWGLQWQDIPTTFKHYTQKGQVAKVADGSLLEAKGFPVLLPIDYSRISGNYGSLVMGSSFGSTQFHGSPTFDAAVTTSLQDS